MRDTGHERRARRAVALLAVLLGILGAGAGGAGAQTMPPGFGDTTLISGLTAPTAVRFAPDGRVFVIEKGGLVKEFESLTDPAPRVVADLRDEVMDYVDRGLLGLAVPPGFPGSDPSIYVSYALDAPIGGTPPVYHDNCPDVTTANCLTGARVSRINVATGAETVLLEDWCEQYPSHTIGGLAFGSDGSLYASGGEGADYNAADWGQNGQPPNPCGDPPGPVNTALTRPASEGGALRSQDVRTTGDPTGLDGTIIRIDPQTGAGRPGNPFASSPNANARRIVAYGMRNPWRMTVRPGTDELWFSEVGWGTLEEINRIVVPDDAIAENYGWPCFEGTWRQPFYTGLDLCDSLLASETVPPFFNYFHDVPIAGEDCPNAGASVSGISFVPTANQYPAAYQGALFFSDYSRSCMWVMQRSATSGALPDPATVKVFREDASGPVDLQAGPGGYLYYVDLFDGTVGRIDYSATKPVARFKATPSVGDVPLAVTFDASASNDPDGTTLSYAWDFGDGSSGTGKTPSHTFTGSGRYVVQLTVTDVNGDTGTTTRLVSAGVPAVSIDAPSASKTWRVGESLAFAGGATDNRGRPIRAADLEWTVVLEHGACPLCHEHAITSATGASGSALMIDHDLPSSILLRLRATDSDGLVGTATRRLQPRTTQLTVASSPAGAELGLDAERSTQPITKTVIAGSAHSLEAPAVAGGRSFAGWSDGGGRAHGVHAPDVPATTYTARYENRSPAATFTVSDPVPDKGEVVRFDASGSSDPEGTALTYAWDLDADGAFDDAAGAKTARAFTAGGASTVRLRVTDALGGVSETARTVTLPNLAPTIRVSAFPPDPFGGSIVTLTAVAADADGTIASIGWDLDSGEAFDDGSGATISRAFDAHGPRELRARATDDDGATAVAGVSIDVAPARLKPAPKVRVATVPARRGAMVRRLSVKAPRGAAVRVSCKGEGCPKAKRLEGTGAAKRVRRFERRFRGGTKLEVRVTEPDVIGAYVKLKIRSRHRGPVRSDACLWPGESKPRACPAG
jgi:glucose/arabinose dehydrogenase